MTVWQPGMRCVCVHAWNYDLDDHQAPEVGKVYTVRAVYPGDHPWNTSGGPVLLLQECDNRHFVGALLFSHSVKRNVRLEHEPGFPAEHFRPLTETRLDQFRSHLNRIPSDLVPA